MEGLLQYFYITSSNYLILAQQRCITTKLLQLCYDNFTNNWSVVGRFAFSPYKLRPVALFASVIFMGVYVNYEIYYHESHIFGYINHLYSSFMMKLQETN